MPVPHFDVDDSGAIQRLEEFELKMSKYLHTAMTETLDQVGIFAVGKYMRHTKATFRKGGKVSLSNVMRGSDKIHIRTGRLARSIMRQFSYAQGSEGANEGIRDVKRVGDALVGKIGTRVPYGAIHEFGGTIPARVVKTKTGKTFTLPPVKIPARPYLSRAIQNRSLQKIIVQIFEKRINEASK